MQIRECHPLPETLPRLPSVFSMKSFSFLWLPRLCASNLVPSAPHHSLYPPPVHLLGQPFFSASSRHTLSFSLQGSCTCCSSSLEHFPSRSSWGRSSGQTPPPPRGLLPFPDVPGHSGLPPSLSILSPQLSFFSALSSVWSCSFVNLCVVFHPLELKLLLGLHGCVPRTQHSVSAQ